MLYSKSMQFAPLAEDIVFIDTEFTSLDPAIGELLSVGIVKQDGSTLYLELETTAPIDPWVERHVMPQLKQQKISASDAKQQIRAFIGRKMPYAMAYVDNYDNLYLVKLFGVGKLPFKWMTLDFSTVLFMHGVDPAKLLANGSDVKVFYESLGIDFKIYRQHHALDDALLLRDVWQKLIAKIL